MYCSASSLISCRRQRQSARVPMRVPSILVKGSGRSPIAGRAPAPGNAGRAGQPTPVFSTKLGGTAGGGAVTGGCSGGGCSAVGGSVVGCSAVGGSVVGCPAVGGSVVGESVVGGAAPLPSPSPS